MSSRIHNETLASVGWSDPRLLRLVSTLSKGETVFTREPGLPICGVIVALARLASHGHVTLGLRAGEATVTAQGRRLLNVPHHDPVLYSVATLVSGEWRRPIVGEWGTSDE